MMAAVLKRILCAACLLVLAACGGVPAEYRAPVTQDRIAALSEAIAALGPQVDRDEARRAAEIAYGYTAQLAVEYRIEDPPLVHNAKVNAGIKPRGLCWHWAEDMERRLNAEGFETLAVERAIANAFNPVLIDHSTAVIVARGDGFEDGIVLDPWRYGGRLFWAPTLEDTRYDWMDQQEVFRRKLAADRPRQSGPVTSP